MKTIWLENTKGEDRENLKNYILSNKKLLDILSKICYNIYREVEKESFNYESASWAFKQAHANGQKEILNKIIDLCNVTNE